MMYPCRVTPLIVAISSVQCPSLAPLAAFFSIDTLISARLRTVIHANGGRKKAAFVRPIGVELRGIHTYYRGNLCPRFRVKCPRVAVPTRSDVLPPDIALINNDYLANESNSVELHAINSAA